MASTAQKRIWWADWRCNPLKMVTVAFPGTDRDWNLPVADKSAPAWHLFASLMRKHNYLFEEVSGGTYNCRKIAGTDAWSLHAYGIAIDLNPSKNPFGTTRHNYPQGFIDDVLATGLFKWLHTFDPMHWEIDVAPADTIEEDDMPLNQTDLDAIANVLRAELGLRSRTDYQGNDYRQSAVVADTVARLEYGSGESRAFLGKVVVQARDFARAAFMKEHPSTDLDLAELTRAIADLIEDEGIAQAVADEMDRRQRDRLG